MKVILSKEMRMIAMIVMGIIIITYMFYNSIKQGFGGNDDKEKEVSSDDKGAASGRDPWKGTADCEAKEKEDWDKVKGKMKCFTAEGEDGGGSWGECSEEVAEHTDQMKRYEKIGQGWIKEWCQNQKEKNDMKNSYGKEMTNWMSKKFNKWKADEVMSMKDDAHKYHFGSGKSAPSMQVPLIPGFVFSLEFPNENRIYKRQKE